MAVKQSILVFLNLLAAWHYEMQHPSQWQYNNTTEWVNNYKSCGGLQQSPINLDSANAIRTSERLLKFKNYKAPFLKNLTVENNGHTAEVTLPETVRGTQPIISGGLLKGEYEAHSLHFHWGSLLKKGSEHTIDGRRYDAEIHIVHKNMKYGNAREASYHRDGIVVVAILIEISDKDNKTYPGLNKVFNRVSDIQKRGTNTTITQYISLNNFLGDINTHEYYSYKGSLTTPPCTEAVTWIVFAEPLVIPKTQIQTLFKLRRRSGLPIINNYRPLQPLNGRKIYKQKG